LLEVGAKVTNASLTQKSMFTMCNSALMHVEIPRPRDATELNNDGMIKFVIIH